MPNADDKKKERAKLSLRETEKQRTEKQRNRETEKKIDRETEREEIKWKRGKSPCFNKY